MTKTNNKKKASTESAQLIVPAISLDRPEPKQLASGQYLTLKCQNTPGDPDSTTYNLQIPFFGSGTAEEWLIFLDNLNKGIVGQHLQGGPKRYDLAEQVLTGEMLTAFHTQKEARGDRTINNFNLVIKDLASYVFKSTDYRDQKIYMRRYMVKPRDMTIRAYVARVRELNSYLVYFPTGNIATESVPLAEDEIKDILFHGIPKSWQQHMLRQGFSYQEERIADFISFCERLEALETPIPKKKRSGTKSTQKASKKRKVTFESSDSDDDDDDDDSEGPKYCKLHGKCSHTTDQCKDIKQMVKAEKERRKKINSSALSTTTSSTRKRFARKTSRRSMHS